MHSIAELGFSFSDPTPRSQLCAEGQSSRFTYNLDADVGRGACADSSACEDAECKRPQTVRHIVRQVYRLRLN